MVIAPHPDDEAIGCGGTICLHGASGHRVVVVFVTSGELGLKTLPRERAWQVREREAEMAAEILGIQALTFLRQPDWFVRDAATATARLLRPVLEREAPRVIYLPHEQDGHPDHQVSPAIVRAALADINIATPVLWGYEVWTPLASWDNVEDVTGVMRRKLRAIGCYRSQLEQYRYDRAIRGLNQYRGILGAGCRYAEAFACIPFQKGES
jgi:N-acetylglucosamine malate deacetylase 1